MRLLGTSPLNQRQVMSTAPATASEAKACELQPIYVTITKACPQNVEGIILLVTTPFTGRGAEQSSIMTPLLRPVPTREKGLKHGQPPRRVPSRHQMPMIPQGSRGVKTPSQAPTASEQRGDLPEVISLSPSHHFDDTLRPRTRVNSPTAARPSPTNHPSL